MKFRKKPVIVEAVRWTGDNLEEVASFMGGALMMAGKNITVPTLEGEMIANVGDFIVRGVDDELYPVKPTIFAKTYEPLDGVRRRR